MHEKYSIALDAKADEKQNAELKKQKEFFKMEKDRLKDVKLPEIRELKKWGKSPIV